MPSNGIAGSNEISISRSLRHRHTVFHNGCTHLHSYQQCKSVSISPHPLQHLLSSDFFNDHHSNWCEMVSHCGFDLHFSKDQWWWTFFICLLAWYMSSFVKCLFISFVHFWMGLFVSCKSVLVLCRFWILTCCQMGRLKFFSPILLVAGSH